MRKKLENFCSENKGAEEIIKTLGKNSTIKISISSEESFLFAKTDRNNFILRTASAGESADIDIFMKRTIFEEFFKKNLEKGKDIARFFAGKYMHREDDEEIDFKINISYFKLTIKGYWKLISLGGPVVMDLIKKEKSGLINNR